MMELVVLLEVVSHNKKIPKGARTNAPKKSLFSLRAWMVQENSTAPQEEIFNAVIGHVGMQIGHRFLSEEPEVLLYFPITNSWGQVRSFFVRDLKEVTLVS